VANQKGAWQPHWIALLADVADVVPPSWLVLADRGRYARWLFGHIQQRGWHPYLRVQRQGWFRLPGQARGRALTTLVPTAGRTWTGAVTCCKGPRGRLAGTMLACWEVGQAAPWLVVTDLAPADAAGAWYGLRAWIEAGFKDIKRGGWHGEQTQMRDPARVERQ